jgi:flagellar protein FlbD
MIKVTRLNHIPLILNSDLIEHIDVTPDTVVALSSGQKYVVLETAEEIIEKVIAFRKSVFGKDLMCPLAAAPRVERNLPAGAQESSNG